jgi:hypothetical protein
LCAFRDAEKGLLRPIDDMDVDRVGDILEPQYRIGAPIKARAMCVAECDLLSIRPAQRLNYAPFNLVTDSTWVHRLPVKKHDRPNRGEGFFREVRRSTIDFAGPANEIIGVGARGEYCGSGHDKKGKRASQEN